MSLHERYSICRRNCGFPIPNTLLLSYTGQDKPAPDVSYLQHRVQVLLDKYPLLGSEVRDGQTRAPYFAPRDESLRPDTVLSAEVLPKDVLRDDILIKAISAAEAAPGDGPLWHVVRYTTGPVTHLAISAQHELLDGIGLLRLALALTADDVAELPNEPFETVVGMSTPEYKPTLPFLLPLVYSEMLVPALPTWLQRYLRPSRPWPAEIETHPSNAPWGTSVLSIDTDKVAALSLKGKGSGVKTLHPILKVAYLTAIRSTFGPHSPKVDFIGTTPRNERDSALMHPYLTGNYTSSFEWTLPSNASFWSACRSCAEYMTSPAGIAIGRQRMGLLAYLPDPDPPKPSTDPRRATGWEDSYTTKFEDGTNTYSQALSLSNLGRVSLPPGATDLVWGFPGSPFAPPLSLAMIGHEGGLRIFATRREGCPVTAEHVEQIEKRFVELLDLAIDGQDFPLGQ